MANERKDSCMRVIGNLKMTKGKGTGTGVGEALTILQDEAATRGLTDDDVDLVIDVVTSAELGASICVTLIRSLVPRRRVPEASVETLINFFLKPKLKRGDLPVTVSAAVMQWLVGLWEYQLVDRQTINVYYDCFFFTMLKRERLQSHAARLVYLLTKPEDVTRRQVSRLLRLQEQYAKPPKHLSALLSLFKSYKPELVPEKIPSVNIESVWKPIPEVLRLGFEDAKARNSQEAAQSVEHFDWNVVRQPGDKKEQLLPSIRYFQMGSSIYRDKATKSIFDLSNLADVGRYYFSVELPSNATSLLANTAGYHFLTFANYEYQSRFSHNLYNTLRRAFVVEASRFSRAQKVQLLEMTVEFCRYMQQGVAVIVRFLMEYLPCESGEFRPQLLKLLEWCTLISSVDLQENVAPYLREMFLESSVEQKCEIVRCLRGFLRNLFITQNFGEGEVRPSPFLGQRPSSELQDLLAVVVSIAEELILRGLNVSLNNELVLNEALGFYEEVHRLAGFAEPPGLVVPPSAVVYGAFLSGSCALLSRICGLLVKYRVTCLELQRSGLRGAFIAEVGALADYGKDLGNALWNARLFTGRRGGYFEKFGEGLEDVLPKDADTRFDINRHIAVLPYLCILGDTGLEISGSDAAINVAKLYFPNVSDFIEQFDLPFDDI